MGYFEETRARLVGRRTEIDRRIFAIETDLARHGWRMPAPDTVRSGAARRLDEFLSGLHRELGQVEAAIRRIDAREYDCCIQCGREMRHERLEQLPYAVNCADCSRHFPHEYISQLRTQHSSMRKTVASLLRLISEMVDHCDEKQAGPHLPPTLSLLGDLARELPEHFQSEEKVGYLANALEVAPRLSKRVSELMQEHSQLARRLEHVVNEAQNADQSGEAWGRVRDHFRALTLDLMVHEEAENEILECAFLDDIGSAG